MSKKSSQSQVLNEDETSKTQVVKPVNEQKKTDKSKKKEKKPNVLAKKFKEVGSELKKVSWPGFAKVVKQTGVVFAVVLIFTVVLLGVDYLLGKLYELLISSLV